VRLKQIAWIFAVLLLAAFTGVAFASSPGDTPHILQRPALSAHQIVFVYAGDLWTVDRSGGTATRLTTGVGVETAPAYSPDGSTIAFTGDYDGNTDVFTIPANGGVPRRVTYHPSNDISVGWTQDGRSIIFRSDRQASSRYTQLFEVASSGGFAKPLPLPLAYQGQFSPDGKFFAYSPLATAFGFNFSNFVSWGNYRGGRASTVWVANMQDLTRVEVPHQAASDFNPVWLENKVYFLSDRNGPVSLFSYDPASKAVSECAHNTGADIRSLNAGPGGLVYDQLGEIYLYDVASGQSHQVNIQLSGDLPEVRPRIADVQADIQNAHISSTGVRAVFEAHGEVLTVPAKKGPTRNLTNTPGAMEREPVWSPDGQSIAYFSDESGLYALHIVNQNGEGAVKKFPLYNEPDYYFDPHWSPDSKLIAFHDNRLNLWLLDTTTSKLTHVGENDADQSLERDIAWSTDSKWLAYSQILHNRLHALFLYSVASGQSTRLTDGMSDARYPTFDRGGKYIYFTASTNYGGTSSGLDMTSDLLNVTRNIYALVLASDQASPIAPESDDEKLPGKDNKDKDSNNHGEAKKTGEDAKAAEPAKDNGKADNAPPKPVRVDLAGIEDRVVALPLPPSHYESLTAGKDNTLYFTEAPEDRFGEHPVTLSRYEIEARKTEKLAEHVASFDLAADGEKMLLALSKEGEQDEPSKKATRYVIAPANAPVKPGEGELNLSEMQVRVDPADEWRQMYHEAWRIERAYFYDPKFHGVDTVASEKKFEPYVASIGSRSDLNYVFQEMLGGFSVGHLRGGGGTIPIAKKVPGGLLGADYTIEADHYCISKIYTGAHWNPRVKAPLAQPGLNIRPGDCVLSINGSALSGSDDIQRLLEATAGHAVVLRVGSASGKDSRDVTVIPVSNEADLRNIDWIEANRKKVDELSHGKLAYVYLPNTAEGGFTNFNRYYFAQLDKQGAVLDERFNGGGQVADYIIEAMKRTLMSWWSPRYGEIYRSPQAAILGPKVMIVNEVAGSGGDAMPWYFRQAQLGPLVGKRTWGGLVGVGETPTLMDGGNLTAPSFGFFNPDGQWDVENHGVQPDVEVEMDPKAVSEGHDPQLEKAVSVAVQELSEHPVPEPHRPAYPNYHTDGH
jgi:tricorn protease